MPIDMQRWREELDAENPQGLSGYNGGFAPPAQGYVVVDTSGQRRVVQPQNIPYIEQNRDQYPRLTPQNYPQPQQWNQEDAGAEYRAPEISAYPSRRGLQPEPAQTSPSATPSAPAWDWNIDPKEAEEIAAKHMVRQPTPADTPPKPAGWGTTLYQGYDSVVSGAAEGMLGLASLANRAVEAAGGLMPSGAGVGYGGGAGGMSAPVPARANEPAEDVARKARQAARMDKLTAKLGPADTMQNTQADVLLNASDSVSADQDERNKAAGLSDRAQYWSKMAEGAAASVTEQAAVMPLALIPGVGPMAAIEAGRGLAGLSEANRAYKEGREIGMSGAKLGAYAGTHGAIEYGVSKAFGKVWGEGLENYLAGGAKEAALAGAKGALKTLLKDTAKEIPEEIITEVGHAVTRIVGGAEKDNWKTPEYWGRIVADTSAQTVMQGGMMGGPRVAMGLASRPGRVKEADARFDLLARTQSGGNTRLDPGFGFDQTAWADVSAAHFGKNQDGSLKEPMPSVSGFKALNLERKEYFIAESMHTSRKNSLNAMRDKGLADVPSAEDVAKMTPQESFTAWQKARLSAIFPAPTPPADGAAPNIGPGGETVRVDGGLDGVPASEPATVIPVAAEHDLLNPKPPTSAQPVRLDDTRVNDPAHINQWMNGTAPGPVSQGLPAPPSLLPDAGTVEDAPDMTQPRPLPRVGLSESAVQQAGMQGNATPPSLLSDAGADTGGFNLPGTEASLRQAEANMRRAEVELRQAHQSGSAGRIQSAQQKYNRFTMLHEIARKDYARSLKYNQPSAPQVAPQATQAAPSGLGLPGPVNAPQAAAGATTAPVTGLNDPVDRIDRIDARDKPVVGLNEQPAPRQTEATPFPANHPAFEGWRELMQEIDPLMQDYRSAKIRREQYEKRNFSSGDFQQQLAQLKADEDAAKKILAVKKKELRVLDERIEQARADWAAGIPWNPEQHKTQSAKPTRKAKPGSPEAALDALAAQYGQVVGKDVVLVDTPLTEAAEFVSRIGKALGFKVQWFSATPGSALDNSGVFYAGHIFLNAEMRDSMVIGRVAMHELWHGIAADARFKTVYTRFSKMLLYQNGQHTPAFKNWLEKNGAKWDKVYANMSEAKRGEKIREEFVCDAASTMTFDAAMWRKVIGKDTGKGRELLEHITAMLRKLAQTFGLSTRALDDVEGLLEAVRAHANTPMLRGGVSAVESLDQMRRDVAEVLGEMARENAPKVAPGKGKPVAPTVARESGTATAKPPVKQKQNAFENWPQKSKDLFDKAWESDDPTTMLKSWLSSKTGGIREEFERRSGIKLPSNIYEMADIVTDFYANKAKPPVARTGTDRTRTSEDVVDKAEQETPAISGATGNETKIHAPGMADVRARYVVVELDDLVASHSGRRGDLQPREDYPAALQPRAYAPGTDEYDQVFNRVTDFRPERMLSDSVVASEGPTTVTPQGEAINGNSRIMMLEVLNQRKRFHEYRKALEAVSGRFGIEPEAYADMRRPVLVRMTDLAADSDTARKFAVIGNESSGTGQNVVQLAAANNRLLNDELFKRLDLESNTFSEAVVQREGRDFRKALFEATSPTQRATYFMGDEYGLTEAGKEYVRYLMMTKLFDPSILLRMKEEMKGKLNSLEAAVPVLLNMRLRFPKQDITKFLTEAAGYLAANPDAKGSQLAQGDMMGGPELSPEAIMFADFIQTHGLKPKKVRGAFQDIMRGYLSKPDWVPDGESGMLFGDQESMVETITQALDVDHQRNAFEWLDKGLDCPISFSVREADLISLPIEVGGKRHSVTLAQIVAKCPHRDPERKHNWINAVTSAGLNNDIEALSRFYMGDPVGGSKQAALFEEEPAYGDQMALFSVGDGNQEDKYRKPEGMSDARYNQILSDLQKIDDEIAREKAKLAQHEERRDNGLIAQWKLPEYLGEMKALEAGMRHLIRERKRMLDLVKRPRQLIPDSMKEKVLNKGLTKPVWEMSKDEFSDAVVIQRSSGGFSNVLVPGYNSLRLMRGTSKDNLGDIRATVVSDAVLSGKSVPLSILEEFKGTFWADAELKKREALDALDKWKPGDQMALFSVGEASELKRTRTDLRVKAIFYNENGERKNKATRLRTDEEEALKEENRLFSGVIEDYLAGELKENAVIDIGRTPNVLRVLGCSGTKMKMTYQNFSKPDWKHHIPMRLLANLPAKIANPMAVFLSEEKENHANDALVVMTDLMFRKSPIVAIFLPSRMVQSHEVNVIVSVYDKNSMDKIKEWIDDELLLYEDKSKTPSLETIHGFSWPATVTTGGFNTSSILNPSHVVKALDEQGREESKDSGFRASPREDAAREERVDWLRRPQNSARGVSRKIFPANPPDTDGARMSQFVAKTMGIPIQYAKGDNFVGQYGNGTIYVGVNLPVPERTVAVHEAVHALQRTAPDLHADFVKAIWTQLDGDAYLDFVSHYRETYPEHAKTRKDVAHDEFVATVGEALAYHDDFWHKVYYGNADAMALLKRPIDRREPQLRRVMLAQGAIENERPLVEALVKAIKAYPGNRSNAPSASFSVAETADQEHWRRDSVDAVDRVDRVDDAAYLSAVADAEKTGVWDAVQKMVDAAAKKAGYMVKVFHGTEDGGFTVFDPEKTSKKSGFVYMSTGNGTAVSYSGSRRDLPAGAEGRGVYSLYVKQPEAVYDFEESSWDGLKEDGSTNDWYADGGIDGVASEARKWGIRSFEVQNVLDEGPNGDTAWYASTIAVADPTQIKSADPVTRYAEGDVIPAGKKAGDIIPLSERFNDREDDIRYRDTEATPARFSDVSKELTALERMRLNGIGKRLFGEEWMRLREKVVTPTGREVLGRYQNAWADISTGKGKPESTIYHEAYHRAEDLFLTEEELAGLRKAEPDAEARAEGFVRYVNQGKRNLFGKVERFYNKLLRRLRAFLGNQKDMDKLFDVYDRLLAGKFAAQAKVRGNRTAAAQYAGDDSEVSGQDVNLNPTEAQKKAGNYAMGHVRKNGFDISIENPAGTVRRGKDKTGKAWSVVMKHDYGYIKGTKGHDKDHLDVFLNPGAPEGGPVYVVNQRNPKTSEFDEHKVMMGFASQKEARQAYLSNYEPGWMGIANIIPMTQEEFRIWAQSDAPQRGYAQRPIKMDGLSNDNINLAEVRYFLDNSAPVAEITGREFLDIPENSLVDVISGWYQQEHGGIATSKIDSVGDVVLNAQGVDDSLYHKPKNNKKRIAALAAVPQIIQEGELAHVEYYWKGRNYHSIMLVAPLMIGGERHIGMVILNRHAQTQRFYLHQVITEMETQALTRAFPIQTEPVGALTSATRSPYLSILQRIYSVKGEKPKNRTNARFSPGEAQNRDTEAGDDVEPGWVEKAKERANVIDEHFRSALKTAADRLKRGKQRFAQEKDDISWLDPLLGTIDHYSQKVAGLYRVYEIGRDLGMIKQIILGQVEGESIKRLVEFKKNYPKEWAQLQKILWSLDLNRIGYAAEKHTDGKREYWTVSMKTESGKTTLPGEYATEREGWDAAYNATGAMLKAKHNLSDGQVAAWREVREVLHREYDLLRTNSEEVRRLYDEHDFPPPRVEMDGENLTLFEALERMGDLRAFYMPRIRKPGRYQVWIFPDNGVTTLKNFDSRIMARMYANRMVKELGIPKDGQTGTEKDGYWVHGNGASVKFVKSDNMAATAYTDMSLVAVADLLQKAVDATKAKGSGLKDLGLVAKRVEYVLKNGKTETHLVLRPMEGRVLSKHAMEILKTMGARRYAANPNAEDAQEDNVWHIARPADGMEQAVYEAIASSRITAQAAIGIGEALTMQVANMIESRGSRARKIGRSEATGADVVQGYELDAMRAISMTVRATAGGTAKHLASRGMTAAMMGVEESFQKYAARAVEERGPDIDRKELWEEYDAANKARAIDPVQQEEAWKEAQSFMRWMMRNEDASDRFFGWIRGLAAMNYLSTIKTAVWNTTSLLTTIPAVMGAKGYGNPIQITKYLVRGGVAFTRCWLWNRYGKGTKPSDADLAFFKTIIDLGLADDGMTDETSKVLRTWGGAYWKTSSDVLMIFQSLTEKGSRGATLFASYYAQQERDGAKFDPANAYKEARSVMDAALGVYNKAAMPALARGEGVVGNIARGLYMFNRFAHNQYQVLVAYGLKGEARKSAAWMMVAPMILAGTAAGPVSFAIVPFVAAAFKAFGLEPPDDYLEAFYAWLEETFGTGGERFGRMGLVGLAGLNAKGSLAPNMPAVVTAAAVPTANMAMDAVGIPVKFNAPPMNPFDLLGAPGGVIGDALSGIGSLWHGDIMKAAEAILPQVFASPVKAYREYTEGASTLAGKPLYWGNDRMKASGKDAILRSFGFNPAELSEKKEIQWAETDIQQDYATVRKDISDDIRRWIADGQNMDAWAPILSRIMAYNARIAKNKPRGLVSPITERTVQGIAKRYFTPGKAEQQRAAELDAEDAEAEEESP